MMLGPTMFKAMKLKKASEKIAGKIWELWELSSAEICRRRVLLLEMIGMQSASFFGGKKPENWMMLAMNIIGDIMRKMFFFQ